MRAFEVFLNGERLCLAGIAGNGVLSVVINHVKRNDERNKLDIQVGGLVSATGEFVDWSNAQLSTGDEVRVKIVESDSPDEPKERRSRNPNEELEQQKQYVREVAKQLGWTITEPGKATLDDGENLRMNRQQPITSKANPVRTAARIGAPAAHLRE